MLATRWVIAALSLAISIALIARGDVVIGVLLGALAIARMMMFVRMQQRREQFRARRGQDGRLQDGRWRDGPRHDGSPHDGSPHDGS